MSGFRITPDGDGGVQPQVIVLKTDGNAGAGSYGDVLNNFIGEQLRKALDKKEEKKDDKPKAKAYTKTDMMCLAIFFTAAAPWIGLWMLRGYASALGQYAEVLQHFVK